MEDPAALSADFIGFVTILVPIALLFGIIWRRKWARISAIVWLGIELIFNFTIILSAAVELGRVVGVNALVFVQLGGEVLVLLYVITARSFFADHFAAPETSI